MPGWQTVWLGATMPSAGTCVMAVIGKAPHPA
jgi:hypothetical protein